MLPLLLLLFAVLVAAPSVPEAPRRLDIGTSQGFIDAGKMLAAAMNTSVDPCEDFYGFACGGWMAANPIPADASRFSPFAILKDRVIDALKDLMLSPLDPSPSKAKQMVRSLYRACMDEEAIERAKGSDLIKGIKIDKGKLIFGEADFYQNEKKYATQIKAYKEFAYDMVSLIASDMGTEISEEKLREDIEKVFELEKRLSRLNGTIINVLRNLSELHKAFPLIDWPRYFKLSAPSFLAYFNADPDVYVYDLLYLNLLKKLLKETDTRVVANYIFLSYVKTYNLELDSRFAEIKQRLRKIVSGQEIHAARLKYCVGEVQRLKYATSALYVEKHFKEIALKNGYTIHLDVKTDTFLCAVVIVLLRLKPNDPLFEDAKAATEAMIGEISEAFRESIKGNEWMDNSTRNEALKKLGFFFHNIGYPNWILDDEKLDNFYKALDILPTDSFAEGMAKVLQWEAHFEFGRLLEPVDRFEFDVNPTDINAYYSPDRNGIYFPTGILQPPFFCNSFPLALNYGAIGSVVGHELTHGFDNNGNRFDGNGNWHNWWEPETRREFEERSKCFVKQYSAERFEQVHLNVNGLRTLAENIADNVGLKQSFQAYRKHLQTHGDEPRTPLVDQLTNEQLFFIGFAQPLCGYAKPENLENYLLTNPHSPGSTRVKFVLANQPEFAKVSLNIA